MRRRIGRSWRVPRRPQFTFADTAMPGAVPGHPSIGGRACNAHRMTSRIDHTRDRRTSSMAGKLPEPMMNAWSCSLLSLLLIVPATFAAEPAPASAAEPVPDSTEPAKAPAVGEMKQYWFVMLSRGPRRGETISPERSAELQAGHMAHMSEQHAAGRLVLAGPFGDDGDWRGIQIYDAASKEAVEAICAEDPAVKAGRLACTVHPWWGAVGTALK